MSGAIRSYGKINIGLEIGALRADGFHGLRTLYQTIALHDVVKVEVGGGTGIEVKSKNALVPQDESNTCYRVAERVLKALGARGKVSITIEKNLPVQGGLGAGSSNGVATMLCLERVLKQQLEPEDRLRIACEVGSDLPLFLVGGLVLGVGRGEEVYPLPDLPPLPLVIATPEAGVSTPEAFAQWDEEYGKAKLTGGTASSKINVFSRSAFYWLSGSWPRTLGAPASGVPTVGGDRAEALLLDLVRAGIENDFERVVFPRYPELRDVKRVLEREGARCAALSGSGSSLYGIFQTPEAAESACRKLRETGVSAHATSTLPRAEYWAQMLKK
jgi:4-diphosphocytidyl-2-C-methyl-D-erythritol kinase